MLERENGSDHQRNATGYETENDITNCFWDFVNAFNVDFNVNSRTALVRLVFQSGEFHSSYEPLVRGKMLRSPRT